MSRVTVYHLTLPRRLPLIEESGLRTRADVSSLVGALGPFDQQAPGTYAHGKRVSAWLSIDHARSQVDTLGQGLVSFTVDPAKTLAASASQREAAEQAGDLASYWQSARPLRDWLADGTHPDDLEVHQNVPVRVKHVRLHAPLFVADDLGPYADLVLPVVDEDRLSAKALMHVLLAACAGDFDGAAFRAACACAWRDEPDSPTLIRELMETDPDKVASAVLAEHQATAPDAVAELRAVLDETRQWAEANGMEPGQGLLERSGDVLNSLGRPR